MRIALITSSFLPDCTSAAVQLRDLSREFKRQGHSLTLLTPSSDQKEPWVFEEMECAQVLRLKAPRIKDIGYVGRALGEFAMPFAMLKQLRKSPLANERWDGVIWYAPSIFHGPLVRALKKDSSCKSYLIIRDIFPEWAVDLGLMHRGLAYRFFDAVARYQYSVADVIGVQTPGNRCYFKDWEQSPGRKLEVLQNWLDKPPIAPCSIRISETPLAGRKVFVYAGNMGIAQNMDILLNLAEELQSRTDVGFLFIGRGSEVSRLKSLAHTRRLNNVVFYDPIDPDEIPDLYAQCTAGIVALDPRHKTHNIPGKFLTYMQSGLPVLANVNAGNDLVQIIRSERVGQACDSNRIEDLLELIQTLLNQVESDSDLPERCRALFQREFAVEKTARQIIAALT